ncbi:MAG: alpha-L-fucosidase [Chitinophagaceae bacterium]|nr:alpha-L-fucosidase [Chitinophagaceae bacterium]
MNFSLSGLFLFLFFPFVLPVKERNSDVVIISNLSASSKCWVGDSIPETKSRIPAERAGNTDWFKAAGWGVFAHFLYDVQCVGDRINNMDGGPDWNKCVDEFDTEKFAEQIKSTGASYVIFTMMQRTRYMIAPNKTYDRLTGYKPGEACSTRDLVEDLYASLNKRGIKLMLYWTGDGPRQDEKAAKAMDYTEKVSEAYVQKWADVVAEYGERYKDKVLGWWVDGCYDYFGYNEKKWSILAKGLRTGNAKRIIALNNPKMTSSNSSASEDDYTTGEQHKFGEIPLSRWRDGVQWHILSYLGDEWCAPGLRFKPDFMADYIRKCNAAGGVVSVDICLYRDGTIEKSHLECLKGISRRLKENK